jgi:isopropylmalate/homocitrate/citramalate synthase
MDAREYLRHPAIVYSDIVVLREQIEILRSKMLPKAVDFEKERVQTSPSDKMPDFAAKIDELNHKLANLSQEFDSSLEDVKSVIKQINNEDAREIMAKRYIGNKSWNLIEKEVLWSRRSIFYLHRAGIRAVARILENEAAVK